MMNDNREAELKAEVERWVEKANEAGKAYADANTKHHEELDRANRLEGMCERLAERAVDYQDAQRAAETALTSEREAHAGLRARLEALADEVDGWTPYDSRDTGETFLAESVREFVADLRAALAAVAPVAAEEGGEQEAGEGWERHVSTRCPRMAEHGRIEVVDGKAVDKSPFPCPDCYSIESFWHCVPWEPPLRTPVSRSGSDEQGNRPATPDANGVHDTKGGEAVHLVARDASDAPLARTFCGVATNGTGVRHTASLSIVNCAACLAGLCHADVEDDER